MAQVRLEKYIYQFQVVVLKKFFNQVELIIFLIKVFSRKNNYQDSEFLVKRLDIIMISNIRVNIDNNIKTVGFLQ